jgi:pilus assembly protein CpaE
VTTPSPGICPARRRRTTRPDASAGLKGCCGRAVSGPGPAQYSSHPLLDWPPSKPVRWGWPALPATSILLVDSDQSSADAIASALRSSGHDVALTHDNREAREGLAGRRLLIISAQRQRARRLELLREVRGDLATAAFPVLVIVGPEVAEERVSWFEAGADDVLVRPFDPRELEARVDALLVRYVKSQELSTGEDAVGPAHHLIAFVGAKGGVGTTTVAVNVARAMAEIRPDGVAIVDTDIQRGQVATHLDLTPRTNVADLAEDDQALAQPEMLDQYLVRHASGLAVLASPGTPDMEGVVGGEALRKVLTLLGQKREIVVVDAGSRIDERLNTTLEVADEVVFVMAPDIASLRAMKSLVQSLGHAGAAVSRTTFVLNHQYQQELLKRPAVENVLGARLGFELPYDSVLYQKAVNQGVPLVRGAPGSAPARAFQDLAAYLLAPRDEAAPQVRPTSGRQRLAAALKRP